MVRRGEFVIRRMGDDLYYSDNGFVKDFSDATIFEFEDEIEETLEELDGYYTVIELYHSY